MYVLIQWAQPEAFVTTGSGKVFVPPFGTTREACPHIVICIISDWLLDWS